MHSTAVTLGPAPTWPWCLVFYYRVKTAVPTGPAAALCGWPRRTRDSHENYGHGNTAGRERHLAHAPLPPKRRPLLPPLVSLHPLGAPTRVFPFIHSRSLTSNLAQPSNLNLSPPSGLPCPRCALPASPGLDAFNDTAPLLASTSALGPTSEPQPINHLTNGPATRHSHPNTTTSAPLSSKHRDNSCSGKNRFLSPSKSPSFR
jgi:hypothetical protein